MEKTHKTIGFAAETADAVFSRQATDGHNDTGFVGKTEILSVVHIQLLGKDGFLKPIISLPDRKCNQALLVLWHISPRK